VPNDPIVLGIPETAQRATVMRGGAVDVRSRNGLRINERLLIEALPEKAPGRFLSGRDHEGVVSIAARRIWPQAEVFDWHYDAWDAALAADTMQRAGAELKLTCDLDLPGAPVPGEEPPGPDAQPFDLIALPFPAGGETILGRELIEEAHTILRKGGRLLAATDQKGGTWLKKVLREIFGLASIAVKEKKGMVLLAKRTRDKAEVRDHRHLIKATLRGHTLELESRPGIFGHVRLDAGTKALAEAFQVEEGQRVLDLGCGYGPLAMVAAQEVGPSGSVTAVDCNARAVAQTSRNAARNGLANVRALLRPDLEDLGVDDVDLVLANPPYFSNFRIARSFVETAAEHLRPGGQLWMVAKAAAKHAELLGEQFTDVSITMTHKGHGIIGARRSDVPAGASAGD
jgi:16S rRNA (guanine1207-N2)-methyltransferase